jgi:hypothetical protein
MSRIPMVEAEHASPEVKALYEEIQKEGFPVFNVMKMFANNAKCLAALVNFLHGIYSREAKLTPRLRELAYLRSSQLSPDEPYQAAKQQFTHEELVNFRVGSYRH